MKILGRVVFDIYIYMYMYLIRESRTEICMKRQINKLSNSTKSTKYTISQRLSLYT
jgi:hypothetical protein